jgi:RimJ/RimL family protein N-acetyltransferase
MDRAESRAALLDAIAQQTAVPRIRHFFAVVCVNNDELVGSVDLTVVEPSTGDCGWFIQRRHWGLGYATEAAQLLVKYAFQTLGLNHLTASCSLANPASERVMLKCGFKCIRRSETRTKYEITRDEWTQPTQPSAASDAQEPRAAEPER